MSPLVVRQFFLPLERGIFLTWISYMCRSIISPNEPQPLYLCFFSPGLHARWVKFWLLYFIKPGFVDGLKKHSLSSFSFFFFLKNNKILILKNLGTSIQANNSISHRRKVGSIKPCWVVQGHALSRRKAGQKGPCRTPCPLPLPQERFLLLQTSSVLLATHLFLLFPGNRDWHWIISWFNGFKISFFWLNTGQKHYFAGKGLSSQSYGVSSSHVWMWELDHKESWVPKNWCVWTVVLEKTLESPLDCKEVKPVNPKGNQSWIFTGRIDSEAEAPILWPPDAKSRLIRKDPDAGKDWGQEQKGTTEDVMVGWHHRLNGHEFEQTLGDSEGQGSLACFSPWR